MVKDDRGDAPFVRTWAEISYVALQMWMRPANFYVLLVFRGNFKSPLSHANSWEIGEISYTLLHRVRVWPLWITIECEHPSRSRWCGRHSDGASRKATSCGQRNETVCKSFACEALSAMSGCSFGRRDASQRTKRYSRTRTLAACPIDRLRQPRKSADLMEDPRGNQNVVGIRWNLR